MWSILSAALFAAWGYFALYLDQWLGLNSLGAWLTITIAGIVAYLLWLRHPSTQRLLRRVERGLARAESDHWRERLGKRL